MDLTLSSSGAYIGLAAEHAGIAPILNAIGHAFQQNARRGYTIPVLYKLPESLSTDHLYSILLVLELYGFETMVSPDNVLQVSLKGTI